MGRMEQWSDIAVITPTGDIDIASVPYLRGQLDDLLDSDIRRVLVNCQDVAFIDSTGLAFLVSSARRLRRLGGMLSLRNVSADCLRFLQIARLVDVLGASSAERRPVSALGPDEAPQWTTTIAVREGVENLAAYRHRVTELLAGLPLTRDECFDVALAVGEALSNAYDHAGGAAGATCSFSAYADRVVVEVRDCGPGFEIAPDEEPAQSATRGRGIRLMRMLVDSVEVSRRHDGPGTCVRLVKLVGAPGAGALGTARGTSHR